MKAEGCEVRWVAIAGSREDLVRSRRHVVVVRWVYDGSEEETGVLLKASAYLEDNDPLLFDIVRGVGHQRDNGNDPGLSGHNNEIWLYEDENGQRQFVQTATGTLIAGARRLLELLGS